MVPRRAANDRRDRKEREWEMIERIDLGLFRAQALELPIRVVDREAEPAGFEAIFSAEVNTEVLATAQLMGEAATRIKVGSWVANIYLRLLFCAKRGGPDFRRHRRANDSGPWGQPSSSQQCAQHRYAVPHKGIASTC